jgi:deoxyribodipyrimidine photo-lyase
MYCRYHREWVEAVKGGLASNISLHQVDAHNIVPLWEASDKQEYGARTIRLGKDV